MANLQILKNDKAKAIRFSTREATSSGSVFWTAHAQLVRSARPDQHHEEAMIAKRHHSKRSSRELNVSGGLFLATTFSTAFISRRAKHSNRADD